MAQYGEIDPSFPERIMRMAEETAYSKTGNVRTLAHAEAFGVRSVGLTTLVLGVGGLAAAVVFGFLGIESGVIGGMVASGLVGVAKVASALRGRRDD